jgi:twinkle protein
MKRGITEETCRKAGYQFGELADGTKVHIANIYDADRRLLAQKTRDKDKGFSFMGPGKKNPPLYLQWTWPARGKAVTLTEGELDALAYWQAWDHRWPVGSLLNGADGVEKEIMRAYERLLDFDTIYLAFDADEPGRKATEKACRLLPVGRVKIISFPEGCKDANDVLLKHGPAALQRAFYDAKTWRPDGLREGREFTRDRMKRKQDPGYTLPFPTLNMMWMGLRPAEVTTICAGSGIGKTTIARDIAYSLRMEHGLKVGNIFLEEDNDTSVKAYVGLHQGVPLKQLIARPESISDEQWDASLEAVVWDGMMFYDHFGSLESDRLLMMMRYMAASGCKFIVLDHISIVVSGIETHDERKDIDVLMTKLASFVKETGVGVIAVVHLKRAQGKNFNEGGQISLNDLRGSASIEQLSFNVLAAERDQQDPKKKAFARLRSLKCRVTGETGEADLLKWNVEKGRYEVVDDIEMASAEFNPHDDTEDIPF